MSQFRYKGFISYSQVADGRVAAALQKELQRFGKSWYQPRVMRVFRDKTGLSVSPELWGSIQDALEQSEYFVLLASAESAISSWVTKELDWWLRNRSSDNLLIVLTDGELFWKGTIGDFDWHTTTALSSRLAMAFAEEPNHIDLRFATNNNHLSLRHPEFHYAVASLSATLQGCSLDELISDELVSHRKVVRWAAAASVGFFLLSAIVGVAVQLASRASNTAQKIAEGVASAEQQVQRDALSRKLADESLGLSSNDRDLSILLAIEAVSLSSSKEAKSALRLSLFESISPFMTLPGHTVGTDVVLPFDAGKKTISAGSNAELRVLDIATGKTIREFTGHTGAVTSVDISTDETLLLSSSEYDNSVRVWDISTGLSLFQFELDFLNYAFFSPDANHILTVGRDATLWDANTGLQMQSIASQHAQMRGASWITEAVFNPTSTHIAMIDWTPAVYEVMSGKLLFELDDHTAAVNDIDYSADGKWLVAASADHTARIFHAASGRSEAILPHDTVVNYSLFSPDGKWIITGTQDRVLHMWDTDTYQKEGSIDFTPDELRSFVVSPDGEYLLVTLENGQTHVLEIQTGEQVVELIGQHIPISSLQFSQPDAQRIITVDVFGQMNVYDFDLGGIDSKQLVQLAKNRVSRELTIDERQRYLPAVD